MKKMILKYKPEIIGGLSGAIAGGCYWYFVGCASGNCVISSSPYLSSIYGAVTGGIALSLLRKKQIEKQSKN